MVRCLPVAASFGGSAPRPAPRSLPAVAFALGCSPNNLIKRTLPALRSSILWRSSKVQMQGRFAAAKLEPLENNPPRDQRPEAKTLPVDILPPPTTYRTEVFSHLPLIIDKPCESYESGRFETRPPSDLAARPQCSARCHDDLNYFLASFAG